MLLQGNDPNPLCNRLWRILHYDMENYVLFISGRPQRGKSRAALKIGYTIDPDFTIEKNVAVIDPKWFMEVLNSGKLKRGSVIVFDDCGVGLDNRLFHSFMNRALVYIMQTMGHEGLLLILTTPDFSFVDTKVRKLTYGHLMTKKYYPNYGYVKAKFEELSWNSREQKFYGKRVKMKIDNKIVLVNSFKLSNPPKEMLKEYYAISKSDKTGLKKNLMEAMKELGRSTKRVVDKKQIIESVKKDIGKYERVAPDGHRYIDDNAIMIEFDVGGRIANTVRKMVEYDLKMRDEDAISKRQNIS